MDPAEFEGRRQGCAAIDFDVLEYTSTDFCTDEIFVTSGDGEIKNASATFCIFSLLVEVVTE